jgi:hypothetical protein
VDRPDTWFEKQEIGHAQLVGNAPFGSKVDEDDQKFARVFVSYALVERVRRAS